jgi:hypothetical protein
MNEQQPMQYETLDSKPKNGPSGIILFILFLVILGLAGKIAYDRGYLDKILKKENTETKEEVKNKETNNEKEITDKATIDKINEKANAIEFPLVNVNFSDIRLAAISKYLFSKPEIIKTISLEECVEIGASCDEYKDNIKGEIKKIDFDDYHAEYEKIFGEIKDLHPAPYSSGLFMLNYTSSTEKEDLVWFELKEPTEKTTILNYLKRNEKYTEDENYYYKYYNSAVEADGYFYYGQTDFLRNSPIIANTQETNKYYTDLTEKRKSIKIDQVDAKKLSYVKEYYKKSGNDFYFEKAVYVRE